MATFERGERVTHVSLPDRVRSNGTVVDVHSDAGREYFTVRLDDGREVQTIATRLRKGEYTGVAMWQRVLDVRTNCYFFFDEENNETIWDTPEAQNRIFGRTVAQVERVPPVEPLKRISPQRDQQPAPIVRISPLAQGGQQTYAPLLPAETADEESSFAVTSIYVSPRQNSQSRQAHVQNPSAMYDTVQERNNEEVEEQVYKGSFKQSRFAPAPEPRDIRLQPTSDSYARSLAVARSVELRHGLIETGPDSLIRNLKVLGIATKEDELDSQRLAGILVAALSKIALTIDAQDLNLLLRHVLGGLEGHRLADRLSFSVLPSDGVEPNISSSQPVRNIILPRSPNRTSQPVRVIETQGYSDADYAVDEAPTSWAQMRNLSREGSGSMEMKNVQAPRGNSPYLPATSERRPVSVDYRASGRDDDFPEDRPERAYQSFNHSRRPVRMESSPTYSGHLDEQPTPYNSYESSPARIGGSPYVRGGSGAGSMYSGHLDGLSKPYNSYEPSPVRKGVYSPYVNGGSVAEPTSVPYNETFKRSSELTRSSPSYVRGDKTDALGGLIDQRRRDNLWAGVPPPSRPPPNGPSPQRVSPQRVVSGASMSYEGTPGRQNMATSVASPSKQQSASNSIQNSTIRPASSSHTPVAAIPLNDSYTADDYALPPISEPAGPTRTSSSRSRDDNPDLVSITLEDRPVARLQQAVSSAGVLLQERADSPMRVSSPLKDGSSRKLQSVGQSSSVRFDDSMNEIHEHRDFYSRSDASSTVHEALEDSQRGNDETKPVPLSADTNREALEDAATASSVAANLSDLNVSLDKLLADMASAGERIDSTWKPQHEELHVEVPSRHQNVDTRSSPPQPTEVRYAPKPSKNCGVGCVVS